MIRVSLLLSLVTALSAQEDTSKNARSPVDSGPWKETLSPANSDFEIDIGVRIPMSDGEELIADIVRPNGEGPFPVIVTIAGSAWRRNNNKHRAYQRFKPLHDNGFAIVAINHRSSKEAIFPAQLHDVKAVVRFIGGNAAKYQLDTRFIGITGSSSGGHLAALMGVTGGIETHKVGNTSLSLEGTLGNFTAERSHVDAVVDWFGPTDFLVMDSCGSRLNHDAADSPESQLIGGPIQDNPASCALANPITYVDPNGPPILILHGDKDQSVPHCQSQMI